MTQPTTDILIPATNTNYSTGPATGQPTKVTMSAGELADAMLAGGPVLVQHLNYLLNNLALWVDYQRDDLIGNFGDGSDGTVTITGGTTTITRDMYYETLTVTGTGILETNGYRVFVRGTCTIQAGGIVQNPGIAGAGGAIGGGAGTAAAAGSLGGGFIGGAGIADAVGNPGANATDALGGAGGAGGATVGVVRAGGAGGTATAPAAADGGTRHACVRVGQILGGGNTPIVTSLRGGAGGGSGASVAGGATSGGGGGGGGVVCLIAYSLVLAAGAIIRAPGGAAGAPQAGAVEIGGSGGGGGGLVLLAYRLLSDAGATITAAGGAATNGINGGGNGVAGSSGTVRQWRI